MCAHYAMNDANFQHKTNAMPHGLPKKLASYFINKKRTNMMSTKTFTAQATFGLQKKYSNELITARELKNSLLQVQTEIKEKFNILLSTKLTFCEIVCLGQEEPSVTLEWIQYPKFLVAEDELQKVILLLVEKLMDALEQNRVVIVFPNETIMLEKSEEIDPKIQL